MKRRSYPGTKKYGPKYVKRENPQYSVPGLLTVQEAADKCNITFYHAWWMVTTKRWNIIRTGPDNRIIRIREADVLETRDRWAAEDLAIRERAKGNKRRVRRAS